ncbi:MAG: TIGR01458 family HAD-type hydrolase [bacterium]
MTKLPDDIQGFLIDLSGVLYVDNAIIPGAIETLELLRKRNVPVRFCTNTTVLSDVSLLAKLAALGLPIEPHQLFGAVRAAVTYLRKRGAPRCHLFLSDDPLRDFAEFPTDDARPEFVVIGDMGKNWDYEMMQRAFHMVIAGAEIVALHKGRYWQTQAGLQMDIGAFVAGLEYVTGKTATVIGKPSPDFFGLAVQDMNLPAGAVAMVGDDINSDIGGAQAAGLKGILVRTGKYRPDLAASSTIVPDLTIDSIADLAGLFS